MSEQEFWSALQFYLARSVMIDEYTAIDWLEPKRYEHSPERLRITANAGTLGNQEVAGFRLDAEVPFGWDELVDVDWGEVLRSLEAGKGPVFDSETNTVFLRGVVP